MGSKENCPFRRLKSQGLIMTKRELSATRIIKIEGKRVRKNLFLIEEVKFIRWDKIDVILKSISRSYCLFA